MNVLLTGSTGYIGRRLKDELLKDESLNLRLFVRNKNSVSKNQDEKLEVVEGDTFNLEALELALKDIDVAYYLIHSLSSEDYKDLDKISAENFLEVAKKCRVKRIIYLGGLGVKNEHTSEHLLSRLQTGEILNSSPEVQCVWIRAGVIIGSGSASFEIIRNLVEKLPVMITPKWVTTKAQPIAVDDVLRYLKDSLYLEQKESVVVDIGSEQLSYADMMQGAAKAFGFNRKLIPVPFMSIGLSSYWLNIFTPVPFVVAKALIEGLSSEVVVQNDNAKKLFPHIEPKSYQEALSAANQQIEDNQVISRWSDVGGKVWDEVHNREFSDAIFVDRKRRSIKGLDESKVYQSFCSLGGEDGWFDYDFLWEIRGLIDKAIGGVGLNRGRRSSCDLRTGDCLDFWKVVDIKSNERLLLYAQMKLPGKAWLEFKIKDGELIQSAYFYPKGLWGRAYWYMLTPLHYLVFKNMIDGVIKNAK